MKNWEIYQGDVMECLRKIKRSSVHCIITSPPYWGLRDYGIDGQIGLENTIEDFIKKMVAVFRECRRVLRKDGTLWLNIGDSYGGTGGKQGKTGQRANRRYTQEKITVNNSTHKGKLWKKEKGKDAFRNSTKYIEQKRSIYVHNLPSKSLLGIPWRLVFALQADGWILRQDIIWHKPNPMPESVTDRCTKSHEYIFLLTKSPKYFYDAEVIKENQTDSTKKRSAYGWHGRTDDNSNGCRTGSTFKRMAKSGEKIGTIPKDGKYNKRSVWTVSTQPCSEAHFATFPPALILPAILAGTSAEGCCPKCGAPWKRKLKITKEYQLLKQKIIEKRGSVQVRSSSLESLGRSKKGNLHICADFKTIGWKPTCEHKKLKPIPCTVLDPFLGSGTTIFTALKQGRRGIGIELSPKYVRMAKKRINRKAGLFAK